MASFSRLPIMSHLILWPLHQVLSLIHGRWLFVDWGTAFSFTYSWMRIGEWSSRPLPRPEHLLYAERSHEPLRLYCILTIFPWKMQGCFSQPCARGGRWNDQSREELVGATSQRKEDLKKGVDRVWTVCFFLYLFYTNSENLRVFCMSLHAIKIIMLLDIDKLLVYIHSRK